MKKYLIKNNLIEKSEVLKSIADVPKYKYEDGWRDEEIVFIDWNIQYLGEPYFKPEIDKVTYPIIDKSTGRIQAEKESRLSSIDDSPISNLVIKRLLRTLATTILTKAALTTQDVQDLSTLYPQYRAGIPYVKLQRFNHNSNFYEVTTNFTGREELDLSKVVDMFTKYAKA